MTKRDAQYWIKHRDNERKWFADHGGSRSAYIQRYHDYGNGGDAIYNADKEALDRAEMMGTKAQKILGLLM
tara:strand:+ start:826 stop:1038 length:213 start_codon:yes stop_codon:yes gene_type:complete